MESLPEQIAHSDETDNCQICGLECLSSELSPIKLGGITFANLQICQACVEVSKNPEEKLSEATELIISAFEELPPNKDESV